MVIAPSILLHSPPRGRPQLAFQSVVPELLETELFLPSSLARLSVAAVRSAGFCRPHVSDDNPFAESQFKTPKYRPEFRERFGSIQDARGFCQRFSPVQHRALSQRHRLARARTPPLRPADGVISQRQVVLSQAFERNPERFVRAHPRPQARPTPVCINPPPARAAT